MKDPGWVRNKIIPSQYEVFLSCCTNFLVVVLITAISVPMMDEEFRTGKGGEGGDSRCKALCHLRLPSVNILVNL